MFITTKAEFVWDKDLKKYVEVHTEGYEYEGELALAEHVEGHVTYVEPTNTFNPYETFAEGAPDALDVASQLGIDIESSEFQEEAVPYLYEYDYTPERFGRLSAGADIDSMYTKGAKNLSDLMNPTASSLFADFGATKDARLRSDVYSNVGAASETRLLDFMQVASGERSDYRSEIIEYIRDLEDSRGSLFPRGVEGGGLQLDLPEATAPPASPVVGNEWVDGQGDVHHWDGADWVIGVYDPSDEIEDVIEAQMDPDAPAGYCYDSNGGETSCSANDCVGGTGQSSCGSSGGGSSGGGGTSSPDIVLPSSQCPDGCHMGPQGFCITFSGSTCWG